MPPQPAPTDARTAKPPRRLPAAVIALGVTSFFTDAGSDMIFPLLPVFLTVQLGAGPAFLGVVEGAADAVASLLKLLSGRLSDRLPRRKPLVLLGYGLAGAVRPLVALAGAPWHVLAVRVTDRVGKGIRSSPRDALLADVAPAGQAGRAFGFHRAMDHAGAVVGPLAATALLAAGLSLREVFLVAAVPGVVAFASLLLVREPTRELPAPPAPVSVPSSAGSPPPGAAPLPRRLVAYLAIVGLFSLGNSSDAFLLLRAKELGVSDVELPVLWTALHVSKMACTWAGGHLADRVPRPHLIVGGWLVFAAVYLALGAATAPWQAWVLFAVYGLFYGLTEPSEKALVKDLAPAQARGRAFGAYHFVVGASALPAGLLVGFLWHELDAAWALGAGAALAALASIALAAWSRVVVRPAPA